MATTGAVFSIDYAASAALSSGVGTLAANAVSGVITVGKHRLIQIVAKDTTSPSSKAALGFTMGVSGGASAASPTSASPFILTGQIIDTGDAYDSINLGNFHNSTDSIDYAVVILSKF